MIGVGDRCVCGAEATTAVVVHWMDGDAIYRYCEACARDCVEVLGGVELA